jgi:hypothetical protein
MRWDDTEMSNTNATSMYKVDMTSRRWKKLCMLTKENQMYKAPPFVSVEGHKFTA